MISPLEESGSDRVLRLLRESGLDTNLVRLDSSARTAAEAAAAIGCTVAQIAKSLIFRGGESGEHVLVIASGANRVDEARVAAAIGEPIVKADAAFVRERTGYAIGGVAPIGHLRAPGHVLIDPDLAKLGSLWAAGGHPHVVFKLTYSDLLRLTGGRASQIA
jgi:prolyl-tRNA editing enzyme YbaK/EbsC (Cys-tRNA(Pro) deacylase)